MTPDTSPVARPNVTRRRVLIVDDNTDITASMQMVLEILGQDVRVAGDGPTALEEVERFRPALVLLDLGLPEMDGYEVARRIRAQAGGAAIEIIAISGWGDDASRTLSAAAGCDQHWLKPISFDDLRKHLARPR